MLIVCFAAIKATNAEREIESYRKIFDVFKRKGFSYKQFLID
jgi:hypothetical protein